MAHKLNLKVVAEGVETKDDLNLCIKLGVCKIQGFYFDKPLPTKEFEEKYL